MSNFGFAVGVVALVVGVVVGAVHFKNPAILWGLAGVGYLMLLRAKEE